MAGGRTAGELLDAMFHVKREPARAPRRRRLRTPALLALAALLLLGTACARIASPEGWASPVDAGGDVVLVQTDSGTVTALSVTGGGDQRTARPLWSFPGEDDDDLGAVYATPIVDGDRVYIASYDGIVVALSLRTGRPIADWSRLIDVDGRIVATPVLHGRLLYIATEDGALITIDVSDGAPAQPVLPALDDRVWGAPQADAAHLYVATLGNSLSAIDRASGQVRWKRDIGAVAGDLLIDGDLLLAGTFGRRLHALDLDGGGVERWPEGGGRGDGWFWARPLVIGDTVYAATVTGSVYAFSRIDGAELWHFPGRDSEVRAAPVLVRGVLVVATRDGHIYGIDPTTGDEQWTREPEGDSFLADPLVLESQVVYVNDSGDLLLVTPTSGDVRPLYEPS